MSTRVLWLVTQLEVFCESYGRLGLVGRGVGVVCLDQCLSVVREEVSGRGQRGQTPRHVGKERQVREALDVGL